MATLVLGLAGSAVGGPVGGFIGASVGAYIDQAIIMPAIFGDGDTETTGTRVEERRFTRGDEGEPTHFMLGPENPVNGTLIYLSEFREEVTKETVSGGKGGGGPKATTKTYNYYATFAVALGEAADGGTVERIWADNKLIYDRGGQEDARYNSLTIYDGVNQVYPASAAQTTADPAIVAAKARDGITTPTPSYRGTMYIVIDDLLLRDWGNRVPNIRVLVRAQDEMPVQDAITNIFSRAERNEVDTTRVPECLRGYTITGPTTVAETVFVLMQAFNLGMQDVAGTAVFFDKSEPDTLTIDEDDLGAQSDNSTSPNLIQFTDRAAFNLPTDIVVKYIEPWQDWQTGTAREQRQASVSVKSKETVQLPIVMDGTKAREITRRLLWTAWNERREVQFSLPPTFLHALEGDVITTTFDDETYNIRLTRITRGDNFLLEVEGKVQLQEAFTQPATSERGGVTGGTPYVPPKFDWWVLNLPALEDGHEQGAVVYIVAARQYNSDVYAGGAVLRNGQLTGDYKNRGALLLEGTVGVTTTTLDDVPLTPWVWDRSSTVDIELRSGTLESATEEEVYAGANALLIGEEIVQFTDVTALGGNEYRISNLLRGRRNTENYTAFHGTGELVVVLNDGLFVDDYSKSNCGFTRFYKVVAAQDDIDSVTGTEETLSCGTLRSFAPHSITATAGTDNRTVSWQVRSRSVEGDWLSAVPEVDAESYRIEIWDTNDEEWQQVATRTVKSWTFTSSTRTNNGYAADELALIRISQRRTTSSQWGETQEAWV